MPVQRLLVEGAGLPIDAHQERLVAERLDVLPEVARDEGRHPLHAVGGLEERLQAHRPVEDPVQLLDVAHPLGLGEAEKLPLQLLLRHPDVVRRERVVEREGRAVLDRLGDRVLVEVAPLVVPAEDLESALAIGDPVDGRPGEADERRVGQRADQVVPEVAAGRPVRLVHEDEDIRPGAEVGVRLVELVDGRDDQAAVVGMEELAEPRLGRRRLEREAVGPQVLEELALQLVPVDQHEDGRLLEHGIGQDLLRRRHHRQGLARALGVPDEAPAPRRVERPLDHLLDGPRLVLAEDDLPRARRPS